MPMWITPPRKVPVVSTTARPRKSSPIWVTRRPPVTFDDEVHDGLLEHVQVVLLHPAWSGSPAGTAPGPPEPWWRGPPVPCWRSAPETGCPPGRPLCPSARPARRSPAPGGSCRSRRWPDCRTSGRWSPATGSAAASWRQPRSSRSSLAAGMAAPITMTSKLSGNSIPRPYPGQPGQIGARVYPRSAALPARVSGKIHGRPDDSLGRRMAPQLTCRCRTGEDLAQQGVARHFTHDTRRAPCARPSTPRQSAHRHGL